MRWSGASASPRRFLVTLQFAWGSRGVGVWVVSTPTPLLLYSPHPQADCIAKTARLKPCLRSYTYYCRIIGRLTRCSSCGVSVAVDVAVLVGVLVAMGVLVGV